jgi:hypothetical protein
VSPPSGDVVTAGAAQYAACRASTAARHSGLDNAPANTLFAMALARRARSAWVAGTLPKLRWSTTFCSTGSTSAGSVGL